MKIPQVDIHKVGLGSTSTPTVQDYRCVGEELFAAFEAIGFVYIKEHGIPREKIRSAMEESKNFFRLSAEAKMSILRDPKVRQGYVAPGMELFNRKEASHEIRESYQVSMIDGELALFPDASVPGMREALTNLAKLSRDLAIRLLKSLAGPLGVDPEFLTKCHNGFFTPNSISTLRCIYYPPIEVPLKPGVVRCGEHSDYGLITLLYQDDVGGLEVRDANKRWVEATPVEDGVLVNVGDMLEMFTNGRLPATRHRVVIPEEELRRRISRQSIVFFVHPNHDTIIEPLPNFSKREGCAEKFYKPVTALEYVEGRFSATYQY